MISGWYILQLWFSSYWCLKFVELLESQKPSFSIFLVLKGLNKRKEIKNYSKPPKLLSQSLFKQFKIEDLTLSLPATRCAGHNTDLPSNCNISKTVWITIAFTRKFFKEYCISCNKRSGRLLNFETVRCGAYQREALISKLGKWTILNIKTLLFFSFKIRMNHNFSISINQI